MLIYLSTPFSQRKRRICIECAVINDEIKSKMEFGFKMEKGSRYCKVKLLEQIITGPHMLSRFSVNERKDLYKNDVEVARAYAECIKDEIDQLQKLGCERIQFDEPVLTESPDECTWAADVINDIVETFPNM